jgi:hypothetical protein
MEEKELCFTGYMRRDADVVGFKCATLVSDACLAA